MQSSETEDQSAAILRQDGHDTDSCGEGGRGTGPTEKKKIPPDDIIIAIHGMGDQVRCGMVHTVADHLCRYLDMHTRYSLGALHGKIIEPKAKTVDFFPPYEFVKPNAKQFKLVDLELRSRANNQTLVFEAEIKSTRNGEGEQIPRVPIGLSEFYWADVARENAQERYTLEECKRWISQLVTRLVLEQNPANVIDDKAGGKKLRFDPSTILSQMVDGVRVLERLCAFAGYAFGRRPDLSRILTDYLGDVQQITEFQSIREEILQSFCARMQKIHEDNPKAKIHLLAHSEGTVVTFLAILREIRQSSHDPDSDIPEKKKSWLSMTTTFITLGSPLDKHLHMWRELFPKVEIPKEGTTERRKFEKDLKPEKPVEWYNYYDFGDPVGFDLDETRRYIEQNREPLCKFIRFSPDNDVAFSRYLLPGKAHIDYFDDKELFDHLFKDVIRLPLRNSKPRPPTLVEKWVEPVYDLLARLPWLTAKKEKLACVADETAAIHLFKQPSFGKKWGGVPVSLVSSLIPYLASFLLMVAGVYLFYRAIDSYLPLAETAWGTARNVFAITFFLWCTTVAIGIARMVGVVEHLRITGDDSEEPPRTKANQESEGVGAASSLPNKAVVICYEAVFPTGEAKWLSFWAYITLLVGLLVGYRSMTEAGRDRLLLSLQVIPHTISGELVHSRLIWYVFAAISLAALILGVSHCAYRYSWVRRAISFVFVLFAMGVLLLNRGVENSPYNQFLESRPHPSNPEFDRDALKKIVAGVPLVTVVAKEVGKDTPKEVEENPKGETSPARQTSVTPAPKPPVAPPEVWLLVLGTGALLYLWWLVVILIDLTLIWHAEIRWGQVDKKNWACRGHDKHGKPLMGSQ